MRSKLISVGPYLAILAHRFLMKGPGSQSHPGALPAPEDVGGGGCGKGGNAPPPLPPV